MIEQLLLKNAIEQKQDLANICKGRCIMFIYNSNLNYCTASKVGNIKCSNLYDYTNFRNVCLYKK